MILLLLPLAVDGPEAAEEDGDERHDDEAAVRHHHPLGGGRHLARGVHRVTCGGGGGGLRVSHRESANKNTSHFLGTTYDSISTQHNICYTADCCSHFSQFEYGGDIGGGGGHTNN